MQCVYKLHCTEASENGRSLPVWASHRVAARFPGGQKHALASTLSCGLCPPCPPLASRERGLRALQRDGGSHVHTLALPPVARSGGQGPSCWSATASEKCGLARGIPDASPSP